MPVPLFKQFTQLFSDLGKINSLGMLHRDFKPDDILVKLDEELLITDFGISERILKLKESGR